MSKKLSKNLKKLRQELDSVKFKCKQNCFECCTSIDFTPEELQRMNQSLRKQGIEKPPCGKGKDNCEYLNKDGKCSVYKERPIICRAFGKVDTPFLTCSHFRDCPKIKQSMNLFKYMSHCSRVGVRNKNGLPSDITKKVMQGDPQSVMLFASQFANMFKDGLITEEQFKFQLDQLEDIMQKKGDSLNNYMK